MKAPIVEVGQKVMYSPDHCHILNWVPSLRTSGVVYLFRFFHAKDLQGKKAGDEADLSQLGQPVKHDREKGIIHFASGHAVRYGPPRFLWPAVVREVLADGTVALDIAHPIGGITLHYPDHAVKERGVPYDDAAKAHSWSLPDPKGIPLSHEPPAMA